MKSTKKIQKAVMIASIAAGSIFMTSCSQVNATKYNDTVVGLYDGFATKLSSNVQTIVDEKTTKEVAAATSKALETTTDSCIKVMNDLKPMSEAKAFHEKTIGIFTTVKTEFLPEIQKMVALKGTTDVNAYNKLVESITATSDKVNKQEGEVKALQLEFAKKVNLQIK